MTNMRYVCAQSWHGFGCDSIPGYYCDWHPPPPPLLIILYPFPFNQGGNNPVLVLWGFPSNHVQ